LIEDIKQQDFQMNKILDVQFVLMQNK